MTKFTNIAVLLALLAGANTACDMEGLSTESGDDADSVGETSHEVYNPTSPPTPVATDACDDPTYPGAVWSSQSSAHVTVHYIPGTAAERDIAAILTKREAAYQNIRAALGLAVEPQVAIYLSPNRMAAGAHNRALGQAFPGQNRVEAVYTGTADSFEVKHPGNLLARTLEYHIDPANTRRLPILSTGLGEVLDQSGRDLHDAYAVRVRAGVETRTRMTSFETSDLTARNTGRAGSLVQLLIDRYGMATFLDILKASTLTSAPGCSSKNATYGCISTPAAMTTMLGGIVQAKTGDSWATVAAAWKAEVESAMATARVALSAADNAALTNLVNLMDQAIVTGDPAIYRSTMEGFYCDWTGEAGRQDIADRTIDTYGSSTSYVMRIYPAGTQNFNTARVLIRRIDERKQVSFHTLSAEHLPEGWRISYGPDWF